MFLKQSLKLYVANINCLFILTFKLHSKQEQTDSTEVSFGFFPPKVTFVLIKKILIINLVQNLNLTEMQPASDSFTAVGVYLINKVIVYSNIKAHTTVRMLDRYHTDIYNHF